MKFNISHETTATVTIPVDDDLVIELLKNHMQKLMEESGKYHMDFVRISVTPQYNYRAVTEFEIVATHSHYVQSEL